MAQRTEIILIDDVDGGEAHETLEFSLDGVTYEIDLSTDNASRLRSDFDRWAESARRVGGGTKKKAASTTRSRGADLKKVREWARANGRSVSDRGRVPAELQQAYEASMAG